MFVLYFILLFDTLIQTPSSEMVMYFVFEWPWEPKYVKCESENEDQFVRNDVEVGVTRKNVRENENVWHWEPKYVDCDLETPNELLQSNADVKRLAMNNVKEEKLQDEGYIGSSNHRYDIQLDSYLQIGKVDVVRDEKPCTNLDFSKLLSRYSDDHLSAELPNVKCNLKNDCNPSNDVIVNTPVLRKLEDFAVVLESGDNNPHNVPINVASNNLIANLGEYENIVLPPNEFQGNTAETMKPNSHNGFGDNNSCLQEHDEQIDVAYSPGAGIESSKDIKTQEEIDNNVNHSHSSSLSEASGIELHNLPKQLQTAGSFDYMEEWSGVDFNLDWSSQIYFRGNSKRMYCPIHGSHTLTEALAKLHTIRSIFWGTMVALVIFAHDITNYKEVLSKTDAPVAYTALLSCLILGIQKT